MYSKVIRYTLFQDSDVGHGGDKRTAQISWLLNDAGIHWKRIPTGMESPGLSFDFLMRLFRMTMLYLKVMVTIHNFCHPVRFYRTIRITSKFSGIFDIEKGRDGSVLLWEMTKSEYSFIVPLFRGKGFRIISIPHNIESMVPEQRSAVTNRLSPRWINEEIRLLKKCDHVFSISHEDTMLLRKLGIEADFLPYYPSPTNLKFLLDIRNRRFERKIFSTGRRKILLLGSALNPPTRLGMEYIIDLFIKNEFDFCDLIIAGYGTERFQNMNKASNIIIKGELSQIQLSNTIAGCDVALVHHFPSSGFITRIIEFLIAGVPVISNPEGALNYHSVDGVYVYKDESQLAELIKRELDLPPVPEKPEKEFKKFVNKLDELIML
ncbi:MAG TPA: glycosyltransferase [Bacteroidales bacterium]|nr:glycosyltransferase [Bacteroidales bacterium]